MTDELKKILNTNKPASQAPMALVTAADSFTLPGDIGNLKSRETKTV